MNPPPLAVQTEYPGKAHRVLIRATVLPVHRLHTGLMYIMPIPVIFQKRVITVSFSINMSFQLRTFRLLKVVPLIV